MRKNLPYTKMFRYLFQKLCNISFVFNKRIYIDFRRNNIKIIHKKIELEHPHLYINIYVSINIKTAYKIILASLYSMQDNYLKYLLHNTVTYIIIDFWKLVKNIQFYKKLRM